METACMPATISFGNILAGADSYQWNFGNGQTSFAPSQAIDLPGSGHFTISLPHNRSRVNIALNLIPIYPRQLVGTL